jgi:hypothetical protein
MLLYFSPMYVTTEKALNPRLPVFNPSLQDPILGFIAGAAGLRLGICVPSSCTEQEVTGRLMEDINDNNLLVEKPVQY